MLGTIATEGLIGALDGFGASGDAIAGRHWDSPGLGSGVGGGVVLNWGWAPIVQVGSLLLGAGTMVASPEGGTGRRVGRDMVGAGATLLFRALIFKAAQHTKATPAPTQG